MTVKRFSSTDLPPQRAGPTRFDVVYGTQTQKALRRSDLPDVAVQLEIDLTDAQ